MSAKKSRKLVIIAPLPYVPCVLRLDATPPSLFPNPRCWLAWWFALCRRKPFRAAGLGVVESSTHYRATNVYHTLVAHGPS